MLPIITNVQTASVSLDRRHGVIVHVTGNTPPGRAQSGNSAERLQFWAEGKRLNVGGLVAVVTKMANQKATVSLASIANCKSCHVI